LKKKKNTTQNFDQHKIKICSVQGPWCGSTLYSYIYRYSRRKNLDVHKNEQKIYLKLVKKYHRMAFFCFRSSSSILNVKKTCSINLSIVNSKVGLSDGLFTQVLISEFNYYILDTLIKCECSEAQPIIIINRTNKL
jgi:hypothetical protein